MGVKRNLSKLGLSMSFLAAVAYELTGANFLRTISLVVGIVSLSILISHVSDLKHIGRIRELTQHIRLIR